MPTAPGSPPCPELPDASAKELAWLAALVDSTDDAAIIARDIQGTIVAWNAAAQP